MSYRTFCKLMLSLTCTLLLACGDDSTTPSFSQQEYNEYVGSSKMQNDIESYVEFMLKAENLRMYYLVSTMNENYEFFKDSIDDEEYETFYKKIEEINSKSDEYEAALQNILNSGILEKETRALMKIGLIASGFEWIMTLKNSGTKSRETVMDIMNSDKNLMAQREKLFDDLPNSLKKGETDYKTWWNNFNNGEYDKAASAIYSTFHGNTDVSDFLFAEEELKVSPNKLAHEVGKESVEKAAEFELEILKEVADPVSTGIDAVEYMNLSGEIAKAAKDGDMNKLVEEISNTLDKATGMDDVKKTAKLAGTIVGMIESKNASINGELPEDAGKIEISDTDKSSSAAIGIAVTESGKIITSLGTDENGKIGIIVPEGETVKVTAIDEIGDKFTQFVEVIAGKITEVIASTTESETLKNSSSSAKSSSSTKYSSSGAEPCDVYKGSTGKYMNCLLLGEWNVSQEETICETFNDYYYPSKEGDKVVMTFNDDNTVSVTYEFSDGDYERDDYTYEFDYWSEKLTIFEEGEIVFSTSSITMEKYSIIWRYSSVEDGENCETKAHLYK